MFEVDRARVTRLDRNVALKVLQPLLVSARQVRQRFEREARVMSQGSSEHLRVGAFVLKE
jgi:serine/threonine protein kinase